MFLGKIGDLAALASHPHGPFSWLYLPQDLDGAKGQKLGLQHHLGRLPVHRCASLNRPDVIRLHEIGQ
jgi:hypothetical protein